MTDKHTPGPWRKGSSFQSIVADAETGHDDADTIEAYGGSLVCESVKTKANARLIAAAPDLLDVLESAQESIATFIGVHGYSVDSGAQQILDQVTAAIAKAKGGAV